MNPSQTLRLLLVVLSALILVFMLARTVRVIRKMTLGQILYMFGSYFSLWYCADAAREAYQLGIGWRPRLLAYIAVITCYGFYVLMPERMHDRMFKGQSWLKPPGSPGGAHLDSRASGEYNRHYDTGRNDMKYSIFGREPAFYVGFVEAVLALLLTWDNLGLTADTAATVVAFVTAALGFYTAYVTKQTLLAVGVGLAKSAIALFLAFGLQIPENRQQALIALAVFILGAWNREKADPLPKSQHNFDLAA